MSKHIKPTVVEDFAYIAMNTMNLGFALRHLDAALTESGKDHLRRMGVLIESDEEINASR